MIYLTLKLKLSVFIFKLTDVKECIAYQIYLNFECFVVEKCTVPVQMRSNIITKADGPKCIIAKYLNNKPCIIVNYW